LRQRQYAAAAFHEANLVDHRVRHAPGLDVAVGALRVAPVGALHGQPPRHRCHDPVDRGGDRAREPELGDERVAE
jgi:hypothetical protein